jgi:gluconate 2-dehydrogenase gamma chain
MKRSERLKIGRRGFLLASAAAAGCSPTNNAFTADERRILAAVCDRIIPADERYPGAAWAGTAGFIERQLKRRWREHRAVYKKGLGSLSGFADLAPGLQDARLAELEKRKDPFFALVVTHTLQGFYGGPRHGGNRDAISWRMLGVPEPPLRGRQG